MSVDLASIGIEFDTSGLVKGETAMKRSALAADKMSGSFQDAQGRWRAASGRFLTDAEKVAAGIEKTGKAADGASTSFSSWGNALKGLALGAIITQTIRTADALNQVTSRLSLVTKSTAELTQVQQQLFQLSQQNRSDFAATADLYTALARSTKDLGVTQEQLLRITGTFGKALIVSGGSAQSAQAAITQFNQAMASGVLRGEEFNSISEQAPRIMDLLASSLGKTRGELRQLAQDGKLTSDVVLPAILKGAKDVEAEFARMPATVAQAGQVLQNSLGQAILAIDNATGSTSSLAGAVVDLATILDSVTASMGGVNKETQKAGILQNGLAAVFETVAVLAANTAFVLKGIGNELGAIGAQVGAVLRGDFAQAAEIGRLAKLDAEAARAQIDATTRNILNARQRAQDLKDVAGITDAQSRRMAVLNDTIKAGTKATSDNTKAKKAKREESVKVADAIRDEERAMFALLEGEEKYRRLQDSRIEAADEMLRSIEFETQLLTLNTQERAVATAQRELERKGIVAGTEAYDEYIQKIRQAVINREATQESVDRIKEINDEGKRFAADLERGLTDSLFRAFEAGRGFFSTLWDGIKNLFKTTVLKAIIQPVVGGTLAGLGIGTANAGTGGGGIESTIANSVIGQGIKSAIGSITIAGSSIAAIGSSVITGIQAGFAGTNLAAAVSAYSAAGQAGVAAGLSAGSSIGSAAAVAGPYVLAAVAALNALGLFRSNKIVDGGISGTLGGQVNDYALNRRGGTLFSGPSYSVRDLGVSAQNQALQDAYSAIRTTVAGMAVQLGIGNDAIKDFTVQLGNDLIHPDTGGFGIKTQGLTQDEIVKKIEAALVSANDQLAAFALGTTEFSREGETASQTLARLAGSLQTVNGTFDLLGLTLADASLAGADAASKFIELFGGVDQFGQVASSYYQNFYTEAERTAATVEGLRQRFFELGTAGATTREEFRALVEEQQRLHGATSPVVAELLKLESTFASVAPAASSAADAIAEASRAFGLINTNAGLRAATEAEATAIADRRDVIAGRRAIEEANALQAQEAATAAASARTDAEQALRQAYEAEIQALDAIIAARESAVQALEQAYQREAGVLRQAADGFGELAQSLHAFVSDLNGIADTPEQSTARLRARFNATIAAALGGDADAARNIPGAGQDYVDAAQLTAVTRVDMLREIARVQIATEGVIDFAEAQKTIAEQQLDALTQQVAGLLTVDQSVLSVAEAIAALQSASAAATEAEAQKAILTAQVSSLITLNESVLSVRDAILGVEQAVADVAVSSGGFGGGEGGGSGGGGGVTAAGAFGADNIVAQAGNFVVAKDARGNLVFANVDGAGILQTSTGIDNEAVARLLVQSGQDRETLNQSLLGLAAQLDASGASYLPGSVFGGSDYGVDFRDLANGGFGGNNFTLDLNAAQKGPTGFGTLQQNQQIAAALGITNANRELIDSYRDLSFLQEGLGNGPGGTSPITTDELARYRIPGFATGGIHTGGLRWVGENGPELEYTPPSRIFSNSQSNALMDNSGVEQRLERLENALMVGMATIAKNTADTSRYLQRWDGDGLPEERDVTA